MADSPTHTIHALELGRMGNFIYVIHDHASDRAAVVDPAWDVPTILGRDGAARAANHRYFAHSQSFRPHQWG
jgi:hypothetical protein